MASQITSSPATGEPKTQNEPKRPLMPYELLEAAIDGNETDLKQLLGLNDITPMKPSDCLRSATGMEDNILHILSANGDENLLSTICTKDSSLLKARNVRNETPFHHAARFGYDKTIRILTGHAKRTFGEARLKELLRQKNCLGETALHEAARHGHGAVVTTLMEEDQELAGLINNDSVSPLYLATARGSLDMVHNMVKQLLNREITPSFYSGPKQQTALHAAVRQHEELTKELLQLYSEPLGKGADETGKTPLHFIATTGNHEMAKLLLDKDPSLAYIQDSDESFPLHTAVRMGHVQMIVLLLQRCLDSGQLLDGNGRNFLHIAIEANKSDVIFKLLRDSKNQLPISPWQKMLNRMANTMDNKGNTPLHLAAELGYVTVMHSLLKNNQLDLTLQNKEGQTAFDLSATRQPSERPVMSNKLLEAAIHGNEEDLLELLGLNDPPHTTVSVDDVTPTEPTDCLRSIAGMEDTILHILSANGHKNLVSTICTKDSSLLKAHNVRNETPFHHAARFGYDNTIRILMEHAKMNFGETGLKELLRKKNCLGETALHEAARHGHGAVVLTLMEEDLELAGLVNNDSISPLYLAAARGSLDMVQNMVEKLLNHEITPAFYSGPKKQTALHAAVLQHEELTKELLQLYSEQLGKGADETGKTALHFVASTGNHEMAKLLLDKDPSLAYIQDSDGSFPVHTAVQMGHVKVIVLLLQRCLDSGQLLDGNGRNFLHLASEAPNFKLLRVLNNKPPMNPIFKSLEDSKSKLPISLWKKMFNRMANTMDNKGNTPLHLAAEVGCDTSMHSLLENNELDLTLQNKEGQTAFDISVIQCDTKSGTNLREIYTRKMKGRSSTGWFQYHTNHQMSEIKLRAQLEDDNPTMDESEAKRISESVIARAQLVGLGSVLIATVTFAAAFTLPGGTNQDTGNPILGRKYVFKAFVLADFAAFFLSIMSTMMLVYGSSDKNPYRMENYVRFSLRMFSLATRCMVMALALGLYVLLAPIGKTGILALIFTSFLILFTSNPVSFNLFRSEKISRLELLIDGIEEGANGYQSIDNRARFPPEGRGFKVLAGFLIAQFKISKFPLSIIYRFYFPILAPLIFIFVFALV